MRRPYAYIRKSVVHAGARTLSWEMQEADVRAMAGRRGDTDLEILSDWGRSGRRGPEARPGYRRLLEAITEGQVSVVYAYSLSRLSRSLIEYARLADLCVLHSVRVCLAKEGESDFTSPSGRLIVNILASVAQMEAELAQERSRDMVRARLARGDRLGTPPYGERAGEDVQAVVDAYEAAGSLNGTARLLNAARVPSRHGGLWRNSTVGGILARLGLLRAERGRGAKLGQHYRLARLLRCACGQLLTPHQPAGGVRYWCSRANSTPGHPYPRGVAEKTVVGWVRSEVAHLRLPDPELQLVEERDERMAAVVEKLRRNRVAFLAGDLADEEYLAIKAALDIEAAGLDAEGRVVMLEPPDWERDSPRLVNEWLRSLLESVQLDEQMRPVSARWLLPAWRS